MKTIYKKILPFILSIVILILSLSYSVPVRAADFMPHDIIEAVEYGIKNNDWEPFYRFLYESSNGLMYLVSQMGAVVKQDFILWVDNNQKLESMVDIVPARKEDDNIVFTKEFMAQLKALLDEYAKTEQTKEENGGFYLFPTTDMHDVPINNFTTREQYLSFLNIVNEKGVLPVRVKYEQNIQFIDPFSDPDHPILLVGNASDINRLKTYPYMPVSCRFFCDTDWKFYSYTVKILEDPDKIYTSISGSVDLNSGVSSNNSVSSSYIKWDWEKHGSLAENFTLYSTTGEIMRVFVSQVAAQNYSVGSRKIYFTENYYSYVPEDLTVAVDDLQKSVDDLQKVIDELLKQIGNDTSEKEIEELLRQILEELRKNPGTGEGGGGSGGGDVTVSVDLKETNSWLSKIYTRLGDILSKMGTAVEDTTQAALENIKKSIEDLSRMLEKYLKTITSDLDDIKGQLENMSEEEFNEKSDSFLDSATESFSEIGELAKTKFPFSIPNDMKNFLAVLAQTSPEAAGLYSAGSPGMTLYSDEHGGGGASRPGSDGFIYVEHGGHGGGGVSREPAEVVNGAPVFALPIVIERYGIEEYVILDMAPFEPVSKLSRSLFTMMFMLCLFNLTFKVMGLWGDLVND